jgi:hypothetical protein
MKKIGNIIQQHRQWLAQSDAMVASELEYLDEDLESNSLEGLDNAADSLGFLALYHGIHGQVALYDSDASGKQEISQAIMYRYWSLRLKAKSFSQTSFLRGVKTVPNLTNQLSNAACLLAAFIATGQRELAASVADILHGMLTVKGAVDADYLKARRFEPFMLWLYSVYAGNEAPFPVHDAELGVYQQIVDNWSGDQHLADALQEIAQYHAKNIEDKGGSWDPEFKNAPFDLVLWEVGAIDNVRRTLGLESPTTASPLLPDEVIGFQQLDFGTDDVTAKVESAYQNLFG